MHTNPNTPTPTSDTTQSSFDEARHVNSVAGLSHSASAAPANDDHLEVVRGDPAHGPNVRSEWSPLSEVEINFVIGVHPNQYQVRVSIAEPLPRAFAVIPRAVVLVNTTRNVLHSHPDRGVPIAERPETFTAAGMAAAKWAEKFLAH